jgi:isopenicillin N synthase-like dioxygenase
MINSSYPVSSLDISQEKASLSIPVIDFSAYRQTGSVSDKRRVAEKIVDAFKDSGFIYLYGHGIPVATIENVFKKVLDRFFWFTTDNLN